jgi:hypothetical protein
MGIKRSKDFAQRISALQLKCDRIALQYDVMLRKLDKRVGMCYDEFKELVNKKDDIIARYNSALMELCQEKAAQQVYLNNLFEGPMYGV